MTADPTPGAALGYVSPEALPTVQAPPPIHAPHAGGVNLPAADALRSAGVTVHLASGERLRIRFTFLSLYWIEQEYGSLKALLDVAEAMQGEDAAATPMIGTVLDLMRFSMTPDTEEVPWDRPRVARMLDLTRLSDYLHAAVKAINEAFGPQVAPGAGTKPDGEEDRGTPDPTLASTGSSGGPSPSAEASQTGSGA